MRIMDRIVVSFTLLGAGAFSAHADLIGINYSTGAVFSISTADATATQIGQTATGVMGIDRDAGGSLLAITDGIVGKLGVLDEQSWHFDAVGNLGAGFTFEGGLAVNAGGEIYGGMRLAGSGRAIFRIDPDTGGMVRSVPLSRTSIDLNGLQFRDDGVLVAIDGVSGELVSVDVATGEVATIAALLSPNPGAVGGLAVDGGTGFYVTAGTTSGSNGDNSLYRIDLYTGAQTFVGSLGSAAGSGFGIGALAGPVVPSPASALLLAGVGALTVVRRRRADR